MKTSFCVFLLLCPAWAEADPRQNMSLVETMSFTRDASLLEEQRQTGKAAEDFQKVFPAVEIDPRVMTEVKATAQFGREGRAFLWFNAEKSKAVLDARFFSDLTMVDATSLQPGAQVELGRLKERALALPKREIAWFLMRAGVIQTFAHIESSVRLVEERGGELVFSGTHVFFTNDRNERPFRFRLLIGPDGTLRVKA